MATAASGHAWDASRTDEGRWTLALDRPGHSQNSLDSAALRELDALMDAVEADPSASAVVLRGAKAGGFCAGADVKELRSFTEPSQVADFARLGQAVFARLARLRVPTVAVLHGTCLGGGLELALACGHRLVMADAAALRLGTPEVLLGLVPGWGAIGAVPRLAGLGPGLEMLLTGGPLDALRAERLGLVDRIIPGGAELDAQLGRLRRLSPPTRAPWPPEDWPRMCAEARRAPIADDRRRARDRLIEILDAEIAGGVAAGLAASASGLAELAFSAEGRAALDAFGTRPERA